MAHLSYVFMLLKKQGYLCLKWK